MSAAQDGGSAGRLFAGQVGRLPEVSVMVKLEVIREFMCPLM